MLAVAYLVAAVSGARLWRSNSCVPEALSDPVALWKGGFGLCLEVLVYPGSSESICQCFCLPQRSHVHVATQHK